MNSLIKNKNLAIIYISDQVFALFCYNFKLKSDGKSFSIYNITKRNASLSFPESIPKEILAQISNSNIVLISDNSLLRTSEKNEKKFLESNEIASQLFYYFSSLGVKSPLIISSLTPNDILLHYYSKILKFFPDDKSYILSGSDETIIEFAMKGRNLDSIRQIEFDIFCESADNYKNSDHLILFTADPYAFRFEDQVAEIGHNSITSVDAEYFPLNDGTSEGKSFRCIYNICEMASILYKVGSLPVPGLLTKQEQEKTRENISSEFAGLLNKTASIIFILILLFTGYEVYTLAALSRAENELAQIKSANAKNYEFTTTYAEKVANIPSSKKLITDTKLKSIELSTFLNKTSELNGVDKFQFTKIFLQPNNYLFIKGFAESPVVVSNLLKLFPNSQLMSSENIKTDKEKITAFKILVPWVQK